MAGPEGMVVSASINQKGTSASIVVYTPPQCLDLSSSNKHQRACGEVIVSFPTPSSSMQNPLHKSVEGAGHETSEIDDVFSISHYYLKLLNFANSS